MDSKTYQHSYYINKKTKLTATLYCECHGRYSIANRSNHILTKLHQQYLFTLKNETTD